MPASISNISTVANAETGTNGYKPGNLVQLVHSGSEYFDLLSHLIKTAKNEIHLQYYIFNDDQAGKLIADLLVKAAARKVQVYLLLDGFESRSLSNEFIESLAVPNLHLQFFEPLLRSKHFYIGRRLHHKIAVFDQRIAIIGGINIADRYLGSQSYPAWLDLAIRIEGPIVADIYDVCRVYWYDTGKKPMKINASKSISYLEVAGHCSVRLRRNDWVKNKSQIWKSYFDLFNQANEHIIVMCSYFLPGWIYLKLIKKAIARGVHVQVILANISDVPLAKNAERYLYNWMLRNGVEIYEYKGSVLHAKIGIRDSKWLTIGSYNVNNISALASIELNVDIRNKAFVSDVANELKEIMNKHCVKITTEEFRTTQNCFRQFWQWACYQIIKIVLYLATFYFRQER